RDRRGAGRAWRAAPGGGGGRDLGRGGLASRHKAAAHRRGNRSGRALDARRGSGGSDAARAEIRQFRGARLLPEGLRVTGGMTEDETRRLLVALGASLFQRGFSVGSAGNISVRLHDGYLMTPTNSSLGRLVPERLSKLDREFRPVGGDKPSKEVFMHRAFYLARP